MKADPASQRRLLDVQALDTAMAQLERRIQTLPIHRTIADLAAQRIPAADEVVAAQTRLSDAEVARDKAESDVVPARERLVRNQGRVDDGHLEAKALSSMVAEIEHLKGRIATLEDIELEAMEAVEEAEAELAQVTVRVNQIESELRVAVAEREAAVAEARVAMKELRTQRQGVVSDIPDDLLGLYDKVRARYNGIGAAELIGQRCTGCGLEATTADYNSYIAATPDTVLRCTECERILIRSTI
jgi:predicted  nucleic acid-binding Zn-ribbon protein